MSKDEKSNYYDKGGLETIDIIKAKLTPDQYTGYLLGNTIKYACRLNFKGCAERDAEKLANYSKWLKKHKHTERVAFVMNNCGDCGCSECDRDFIVGVEHHV